MVWASSKEVDPTIIISIQQETVEVNRIPDKTDRLFSRLEISIAVLVDRSAGIR